MATDIKLSTDGELPPKCTVLDFFKPRAIRDPILDRTTTRKTIQDFFPSSLKAPTDKSFLELESDRVEIIDEAKEMSHEAGPDQLYKKTVKSSCTKTRNKPSPSDGNPLKSNSVEVVRAWSKLSGPSQFDMSKAQLMAKKKGKGTANQAKANPKQEDDTGNGRENSTAEYAHVPKEIDYADFVKSFGLAQDGNSVKCDDTKVYDDALNKNDIKLTEQSEKCSDLHALSCHTKKDESVVLEDSDKQNKQKEINTSVPNAFSFLMQARTNKNSKKETEELSADVTEDECISVASDITVEKNPGLSTPSVMNFFFRHAKPARRNDGGGSVLVTVDVHHDPSEQNLTIDKTKLSSIHDANTSKMAPVEDGNEIVFLGRETVEADEDCRQKSQSRKKGKKASLFCKEPSSEKTNTSDADDKYEQSSSNADKEGFLQNSIPPTDKSVKKAQATLQFGEDGTLFMNALVKAKPAKTSKSKEPGKISDHEEDRVLNSERRGMREVRRKVQVIYDSSSEESNSFPLESPAREVHRKKETAEREMLTRQRKSLESGSGSNSKDFTFQLKQVLAGSASKTRVKELLQRTRQQGDKKKGKCLTKKSKKLLTANEHGERPVTRTVQRKADRSSVAEQRLRRQSQRLVEQQKMRQGAEQNSCLVDSDISSDEATIPQKKNIRKTGSSRSSPTKISRQNSPNTGKLAPIFAKKKIEEKTPEPPENPEIVRRRWEFLMSGIPSELKKTAFSSVSVIATSEFMPFPETSHVQQRTLSSVWSLVAPGKMRAMCKDDTDELWEIKESELKWQSLHWQSTIKEPFMLSSSLQPLLDVTHESQEVVLKELNQSNPSFSFAAVLDKFKAQWSEKSSRKEVMHDDLAAAKSNISSDSDVTILEGQESSLELQTDKDTCAYGTLPDILQPKSVSEMIGNESSIQRLKYWLEEWKAFIEHEARMKARMAGGHSDSEFDLSGDDSDTEDSHLCNTMLLVGPHGVGKTAAAYALAHQLCYKVFEVNASSSRQGRHILAQLQEATQSHQVAQKKDGIIFSAQPVTSFSQPSQHSELQEVKETSKESDNTSSKIFTNFFKKSNQALQSRNSNSTPMKESKKSGIAPEKDNRKKKLDKEVHRKRKAADDEEASKQKKTCTHKQKEKENTAEDSVLRSEENNLAGKLNLSSTSLILFDEVDLVFEEDSGFLQTVQHFMNTTKIPIIMTTSDPGFQHQINARFETLIFRPPTLELMTSYLKAVCLAAGLRTSVSDLTAVATLSGGDLRHALLSLQFLALSGEEYRKELCSLSHSTSLSAAVTHLTNQKRNREMSSMRNELLTAEGGSDTDDDFICLQSIHEKAHRIMDNDDDSREMTFTDEETKAVRRSERGTTNTVPSIPLNLYQSSVGLSCGVDYLFNKCMKDKYSGSLMQSMASECLKLHQHSLDILQTSLIELLPLQKTSMLNKRHHRAVPYSSTSLKRKIIQSDVFDSEASDEEDSKSLEPESLLANTTITATTQKNLFTKNGGEIWSQQKQEDVSEVHQESQKKWDCKIKMVTDGEDQTNGMRETGTKTERPMTVFEGCISGKEAEEVHDIFLISTTKDSTENNSTQATMNSAEQDKTSAQGVNILRGSRTCTDGGLGSRLLSSFARYYESYSSADSHLYDKQALPTTTLTDKWTLLPGIEDMVSKEGGLCCVDSLRKEICMELGVRFSRCLWQAVDHDVTSWKQHSSLNHTLPDDCSVSVPQLDVPSTILASSSNRNDVSVPKNYKLVVNAVINSLPLTCFSNLDPVIMDYLPTLRIISQAERCRQIAKAKRRFHHHFDSIGLCLNESILSTLCEEFPPTLQ